MSSVQYSERCSICNGEVRIDIDIRRGDEWYMCSKCGRLFSTHPVLEADRREDGKHYYEVDADGKRIFTVSNLPSTGSYSLWPKQGFAQFGSLPPGIESVGDMFTLDADGNFLNKEGAIIDIDIDRSYIAKFDPETKELKVLWGNMVEVELDPEMQEYYDSLDTFEWDNIELDFGEFLSSNATPAVAERLAIPVLPAKE